MKTSRFLVAAAAVIAVSIPFIGETDPFGARTAMHQITSFSPRTAYAATPELNGIEATSEFSWSVPGGETVSTAASTEDVVCNSAEPQVENHPYYKKWCGE